MLIFIAGLMIGGTMGVIVMCLMFTAKEADRHIESGSIEAPQKEEAGAPGLSGYTSTESK